MNNLNSSNLRVIYNFIICIIEVLHLLNIKQTKRDPLQEKFIVQVRASYNKFTTIRNRDKEPISNPSTTMHRSANFISFCAPLYTWLNSWLTAVLFDGTIGSARGIIFHFPRPTIHFVLAPSPTPYNPPHTPPPTRNNNPIAQAPHRLNKNLPTQCPSMSETMLFMPPPPPSRVKWGHFCHPRYAKQGEPVR